MKKAFRISGFVFSALLVVLLFAWFFVQVPIVQNRLARIASTYLSKKAGAKVQVGGIEFGFLNRFILTNLRIDDLQGDTLLSVGRLKLAITDWFLWQDSIVITYIGVQDVHLKLQRTDTTWNYQFVDNFFGSGEKDTTGGKPLKLHLQFADLSNIKFERLDHWRGRYLIGAVEKLHLKGKQTDLQNGFMELDHLQILGPEYQELKVKGNWSTQDSLNFWNRMDSIDALPRQTAVPDDHPFRLTVRLIELSEGNLRFFNRRKQPSTKGEFDERDIIISAIAGKIKHFNLTGDTIRADVQLSANERSGFRIESLVTRFTMHPQLMEFAGLDLRTNRSRLGPYYAMRYDDFLDMEYFIDKVRIKSQMRNAQVNVEDIAVFAPDLKGIVQSGILSGDAEGTVSNFKVTNVDLRTGNSRITGTYAMKGLIDIDNTIIDFHTAGSNIDLPDLEPWAPELKELQQTPVAQLGNIGFKGSFKGTPYDFFVDGNFLTNVGGIDADLKLKLNGPGVGYASRIKKADLDGGKLLGVPSLGRLVFSGEVNSDGFSMQSPVNISGMLDEISYDEYTYHDLKVESVFTGNLLTANLLIDDPNLSGQITTLLNFSEKEQRYNAKGHVDYADFFRLKLFDDTLIFKGDFDIDFAGKNIDDFLGYARFYNASVSNGRRPLSFDSLLIESILLNDGIKRLSLRTNEATGFVEGRFELTRLGSSFRLFLNRYYPTLIKAPEGDVPGQDFSFEVQTRDVEPFLQLFDRGIGGGNFAHIIGSLNTETNQLLINADIPGFRYGNLRFSDIDLQGNGSLNELNVFGSVANLQLNEQISFPNGQLRIATINDSTKVSINTTTSGPLGNAALSADLFSQPTGFQVVFDESSFIANKKKWIIERDGGFQLKDGFLISDGLVLVQEQQRIEIFTHPSGEGNWNDLFVKIDKFNLGDWLPYFVTDPRLEGVTTGELTVEDPLGKPLVDAYLTVDQFYFNNDSVGRIKILGQYDSKIDMVDALVKSENKGYDLDAWVKLNFADSAAYPIDSRVVIRNERLSILRRYLVDVFDDIEGYANGELTVRGPFDKPAIVGEVQVTKANLLVEYTKCRYFVDSATIYFGDNYLDFGVLNLKDEKGREGRVEGRFYHRFFDSLSFNLRMRTEGMQVLNTRSIHNDIFYGQAVGRATMDLTGPLNNLQMRITGTPTDSSWIAISNAESRTSGEADYIIFREYGNEMEVQVDTSITNVHISLELTANPLCRVDVVLDELTGDVISATGTGNLSIRAGTADPTTMRGRYMVESGYYNYTFQSFIRKPFVLRSDGNNYIEWNGDPYEANMNVTATYIARDVSLRDLMSNESSTIALDQDARNYKGDVWVNALIKGNLSLPDIKFSIEFPQGSVMRNNISALDMLRRISEDESENLRQVTYLIVFRSFAPYRQGTSLRNPGADLAVNTISELVSREMEKILTGVIQDITRDKSLSVDLSTNFYNSSQTFGNVNAFSQYDRVNVDFNLNKTFFNSRVKVNLGSDFDMNVRNTTTTGFQFLPDVSVEFILTDNRRLRAIIFKRDNLDISGRRNRAGASISYRKDFEKLFGNKDEEALFFIRENGKQKTQDSDKGLLPSNEN